jgi:hypothetical protein
VSAERFPTRILSVRGGHWGLDDRDDILNVVHAGGG